MADLDLFKKWLEEEVAGKPLDPVPYEEVLKYQEMFPHLPVISYPNPPQISNTEDENQLLAEMWVAWRAANHRILKTWPPVEPANRYHNFLIKAAKLLREQKISPWTWAAWNLNNRKFDKCYPQLVFGPKAFKDYLPSFLEKARHNFQSVYDCPCKKKLWEIQAEASKTLVESGTCSTLGKLSEKYKKLVVRYNKQAKEFLDKQNNLLRRGKWIWSYIP